MATLIRPVPETPRYSDAASPPPPLDATPVWSLATRIAFRFCFVYFGLYVVVTQMLRALIVLPVPNLGTMPPFRGLIFWVAKHVLGVTGPIAFQSTGSGDKLFDWAQSFTLLLIAVVATTIWSFVARDALHHARLFKWFRLFMRFAVATTFLSYGLSKVVPLQMPTVALNRLVEPFGNFSMMGVLWYSIGASPAYEMFVGLAEVGAGTLLFLPRTTTLGALLCIMDATAVFVLNMTYDVPVKLFAFHLLLMSVVLLAPNIPGLVGLFVGHRTTTIRPEPALASTARGRRRWLVAQVVFGVFTLGYGGFGRWQAWTTSSNAGGPKSPFFGVWDVTEMTVDGQVLPPLLTDSNRWRRIVFQSPTAATFWDMNDKSVQYAVVIDTVDRTLLVTTPRSPFAYQRPAKERLVLDGTMFGQLVHLDLAYRDPDSFQIRSRGFSWIQERPFNR